MFDLISLSPLGVVLGILVMVLAVGFAKRRRVVPTISYTQFSMGAITVAIFLGLLVASWAS